MILWLTKDLSGTVRLWDQEPFYNEAGAFFAAATGDDIRNYVQGTDVTYTALSILVGDAPCKRTIRISDVDKEIADSFERLRENMNRKYIYVAE